MIISIINNLKDIFNKMTLEPALQSVKYGFAGTIPATDQPCLFFNITKFNRTEILANAAFTQYMLEAEIEIVLFTSVLTSPEMAATEAQKYLWQYDKNNKDIGFLPYLLKFCGETIFKDKNGRPWQLAEVGEVSIFGTNNMANSRGALQTKIKLRCLI